MSLQRDEPYRVLFPVALVLAGVGVMPWLFFARGAVSSWPGLSHAMVMSQGFFIAAAAGFLGTMLPRRTGAQPLSRAAILGLAGGLSACAAAQLAGAARLAEAGILVIFLGLAVAALRRRAVSRALPPSFPLMVTALALGAAGAALLIAALSGAPAWTERVGRALAAQGFMLSLVLAMAPILVPIVLFGAPAKGGSRWPHVGAAGLLAGSFAVEEWLSQPAGLALRGALTLVVVVASGALAPSTRRGLHRNAFRLALLLLPIGLFAAALAPERRLALLHVTYVGGFALLIVAVSVHVTLLHAGLDALAERWPARLLIAILCLVAALALRVTLEGFGNAYLDAMTAAAALWLAAVFAWSALVFPNIWPNVWPHINRRSQ